MKRKSLLLISLLSVALIGACLFWNFDANSASAQTKETQETENLGFSEYNARNEFSLTQGGTSGAWNYGYSPSPTDNTFNLFTTGASSVSCGFTFEGWTSPAVESGTPTIARNPNAPTSSCGGLNYPPELLIFHPGYHLAGGRRAVLRWTAPAAGTYLLNGVFQKIDNATTDVKILKNTTESALFSGTIDGANYQQPFNFSITLAAGDTIDFSVGSGGDGYYGDSTGLAITIGQPVTACLTAPANLRVLLPGENSAIDVQSVNPNATLVGDANYTNMGKVGRAFNFDGAGDYVRVEDNAAQKPINQLTVEGWFKLNSLAGGLPHLVSKPLKNSLFNSYALWYDGSIHIGYFDTAANFYNHATGFQPSLGVWTHYAMVINTDDAGTNANTAKLYVNGAEVFSGAAGAPIYYNGINDAFPPHPLLIGGEYENNIPQWQINGQADEVSIYDRALTQSELFNLTKQGSFGKCPPSACVQSPGNLVSWFQGESNALDSRSNNHGTNNGATFTNGKVGQALNLNGSGQHLTFGNTLGNFGTGDFAVEFWIQTSNNRLEEILSKHVCGVGNGIHYFDIRKFNDGRILAEIGSSSSAVALFSTQIITDGNFHHITVQRSGDIFALYIDGILETSGTGAAVYNINNGAPFVIGALACIGIDTTQPFTGIIDEISLYSKALLPSAISSIHTAGQSGKCKPSALNPPSNQVAFYTADGETDDFSGLNSAGILRGNAGYKVGKVGQSFNFDGSGDYIEIADDADHRPTS